ncbi:MAG: DUF3455 domain-containing protein [Comamonadaceae bacterium]|nr:MAG: DUF3455 domain-containing protein [Comamonadaceae bacterium]
MRSTNNKIKAAGKGLLTTVAMVVGTATMMAACSSVKPPPKPYMQDMLPQAIQVPAGNVVALETTAVGVLNYECRANTPAAGQVGWALASPKAELLDRNGKAVINYSGPPATWTHMDGSSVVGTQLAVAPTVGATNLPMQLAKGAPGMSMGMLQNVTYIQRIKTKGGMEFTKSCTQTDIGDRLTLPYQADYIFWKAA